MLNTIGRPDQAGEEKIVMITHTQSFRKIIHIDMDCFYAAVEERDRPEYRGKPLAVGGSADRRGVLCTCNYVARKFGLHSAMSTRRALALCPELILLPVNMDKYREVSKAIHQILRNFTLIIEPLSLDEAYLDVTHCTLLHGSATLIAREIKRQIKQQLALTASAGVAPNKFLAKIASDWHKPDGLFVITPDEVANFVANLPIDKLAGVGKVTAQKMHRQGMMICRDVQSYTCSELQLQWGKLGKRLYELCQGIDERPVETNRIRRSLSVEQTFPADLPDPRSARIIVEELFQTLQTRLSNYSERPIRQQFVKIKFHDFTQTTIECMSQYVDLSIFHRLLDSAFLRGQKPMRLIGLGVRFSETARSTENFQQISLSCL